MPRLLSLCVFLLVTACASPVTTPAETAAPTNARTAVFAAGCFWCVEQAFEKVPGVVEAVSGYTGGDLADPTYEAVSAGGTGHYEAVRVVYDPTKVTYSQLLVVFWHNADPFDPTGQFCDKGESYRAAIFPSTPEEARVAQASRTAVAAQLGRAVDPAIVPASRFYDAETYHQDYYLKNSQRYAFYKWRCGRAQRLEEIWGPARDQG